MTAILALLGKIPLRWWLYAAGAAAIGWLLWHDHHETHRANAYAAKIAANLAIYNDELQRLTAEARAKELAAKARQAEAVAQYQEDLDHAHQDRDTALAQLRAGTLRLRNIERVQAGGGQGAATAAAPGGDGAEGCGLSVETSDYLIGEASRADEVVHQLAACQAVVRSDRGE